MTSESMYRDASENTLYAEKEFAKNWKCVEARSGIYFYYMRMPYETLRMLCALKGLGTANVFYRVRYLV